MLLMSAKVYSFNKSLGMEVVVCKECSTVNCKDVLFAADVIHIVTRGSNHISAGYFICDNKRV